MACATNALAQTPASAQPRQAVAAGGQARYNIAAGALEEALAHFATAAGVSLTMPPALVQGKKSAGLQGRFSVREGFTRLLAGTGLEVVDSGGGAYALRAAAASPAGTSTTLDTVTVTAASTRDARTDGTGAYTAGPSRGATGLNLSQRDTPQSVTVITRQQMNDQGSTSVADVLRQAAGITANNYDSDRWSFNARGFAITNFQYDGVTKDYDGVYDWGATNSDMTIFDRVEVVKGATGLMSGTGDPSATVNFIRKRPTDKFTGSVTASYGSWNDARTELDLAGPLNAAGTLRGRVVGAYQDRDGYMDRYHQKKTVGYAVIEADLSRDTLLTAGVDYQHTDPTGSTWTGFPIFNSDGSRTNFDRSFNPATNWSKREMETRNLFASLEQRLANDWRLKLSLNNERSQHRSLLGSASGGNPDPVTGEGMYFFSGDFQGNRTQNTVQAALSGQYELWGRKHDAMFGAMWSDTQTDGPWSESAYPSVPGSIFAWDGNYAQQAFPQTASYEEHRRQTGFNAATRLRPSDALSLILGARATSVNAGDSRTYLDGVSPGVSSSMKESGVVTPYVGAVVDLNDSTSVYASYTSIFSPQSSRDASRQYLPAVKGQSAEAGVKGEFLDGRINASLALFHIQQKNVAEYVDFVDGESVYRAVKGVTSKGLEAELSGEIATGWNLQAGYTYTHARDAQGQRVFGATLMASQPEHVVRLTTSYRLPGAWSGLTLGGGVSWQSAFYGKVYNPALGDYAQVKQDGYALFNLMARYQFSRQLSLALNVNNLFDKSYYSGFGLFDTGFYGEPRSAKLTLRYQF